jgi:hypothetical protein
LYFFVAIDRTSKFAFAKLHQKAEKMGDASCGAPCIVCLINQIGSNPHFHTTAV